MVPDSGSRLFDKWDLWPLTGTRGLENSVRYLYNESVKERIRGLSIGTISPGGGMPRRDCLFASPELLRSASWYSRTDKSYWL